MFFSWFYEFTILLNFYEMLIDDDWTFEFKRCLKFDDDDASN